MKKREALDAENARVQQGKAAVRELVRDEGVSGATASSLHLAISATLTPVLRTNSFVVQRRQWGVLGLASKVKESALVKDVLEGLAPGCSEALLSRWDELRALPLTEARALVDELTDGMR